MTAATQVLDTSLATVNPCERRHGDVMASANVPG